MTIDTLKFARRLEAAGVPAKQAEAEAEALQEAFASVAVSKGDIVKIEAEISLLRWMVGFNLALTAAVLAKLLI